MKEADAEEVVKKWLKAASDRQGGRQRRLEKKQGMQFLILQSKVIAITLFVCVCVFPCVRVEVIHDTLWYHEVFMYYLLGSTYFEPHKTTFRHF